MENVFKVKLTYKINKKLRGSNMRYLLTRKIYTYEYDSKYNKNIKKIGDEKTWKIYIKK